MDDVFFFDDGFDSQISSYSSELWSFIFFFFETCKIESRLKPISIIFPFCKALNKIHHDDDGDDDDRDGDGDRDGGDRMRTGKNIANIAWRTIIFEWKKKLKN